MNLVTHDEGDEQ